MVLANKAKCSSKLFLCIHEKFYSESVTINPPGWSLLGSFWPVHSQIEKRGWPSCGPSRFGPDLKTEEKLDHSQAGRRIAKAWPVDTNHMNPLAEAKASTDEAFSDTQQEISAFLLICDW